MKGIIFNLLEEVVTADHGDVAWDTIVDAAGLEGAYTRQGSYDDTQLGALIAAAAIELDLEQDEVVRWFGRGALPRLARAYPELFDAHSTTRGFVLTLNDVVHAEVRKLYPGVDTPGFTFDTSSAEVLVLDYRSRRRMCVFAEGLIEGAAEHFGEAVAVTQPRCMHRGDDACRLEVRIAA